VQGSSYYGRGSGYNTLYGGENEQEPSEINGLKNEMVRELRDIKDAIRQQSV